MSRKVIISVGPQGEVSIEADGFNDDKCFEATRVFEELLGDVKEVTKKDLTKAKAKVGRQIPAGWCG